MGFTRRLIDRDAIRERVSTIRAGHFLVKSQQSWGHGTSGNQIAFQTKPAQHDDRHQKHERNVDHISEPLLFGRQIGVTHSAFRNSSVNNLQGGGEMAGNSVAGLKLIDPKCVPLGLIGAESATCQ